MYFICTFFIPFINLHKSCILFILFYQYTYLVIMYTFNQWCTHWCAMSALIENDSIDCWCSHYLGMLTLSNEVYCWSHQSIIRYLLLCQITILIFVKPDHIYRSLGIFYSKITILIFIKAWSHYYWIKLNHAIIL